MFIVIEGLNGVGKTTLCAALSSRLAECNTDNIVVSEPSDTQFGRLVRSGEASLTGRALALAVAADRYHQQENLVQPLVKAGEVVISDRYVPSSLVLQRIDGMVLEEVWQYNMYMPIPDLVLYLNEDTDVVQQRVNARGKKRSRLELEGSTEREFMLYREAYAFLSEMSWRQEYVDCLQRSPSEICDEVLRHVSL